MKALKPRKFVSFPEKKEEEVRHPVPVEDHQHDPPPEQAQGGRGQEEQAHAGQRLQPVCGRVASRPFFSRFVCTTTTYCFLYLSNI